MTDLPKGVYYEPARRRWRVRLYRANQVAHLSYHRTLSDALAAHRAATSNIEQRTSVKPSTELLTITDHIQYLRRKDNGG